MATRSVRFGIGDPAGARSAESLVLWKTKTGDVYLASRILGDTLRVSPHQSGRCHVHGPDLKKFQGPKPPPKYIDNWDIDPQGELTHPVGVVTPVSELRAGTWPPHKAKGTVWVKPRGGTAVEVRVFLSRLPLAPTSELLRIGWHTEIVRIQLPSGRHLTVLAGDADVPDKQLANLRRLKEAIRAHEAIRTTKSPRVIAFATAGVDGVRHLIDAAVYDPLDRADTATT
jgi:hypothetical protein